MNPRGLVLLHGAAMLLLAGVWLLATAAVLPLLVLPARQVTALCWSLIVTAWALPRPNLLISFSPDIP